MFLQETSLACSCMLMEFLYSGDLFDVGGVSTVRGDTRCGNLRFQKNVYSTGGVLRGTAVIRCLFSMRSEDENQGFLFSGLILSHNFSASAQISPRHCQKKLCPRPRGQSPGDSRCWRNVVSHRRSPARNSIIKNCVSSLAPPPKSKKKTTRN